MAQVTSFGLLTVDPSDVTAPSVRGDKVAIGGVTYGVVEIGDRLPMLELQLEARTATTIGRGHEEKR
jgi:hypothetical protein